MYFILLLIPFFSSSPADTSSNKASKVINAYLNLPILVAPIVKLEPETGLNFGFTAYYRFKPNKTDSSGSISTIKSDIIYTTQNQFFAGIKHQLFGKNRNAVYRGYAGYHYFPYRFWGIGNNIKLSQFETYYPTFWQFSQSVFKQVLPNLYLGLSAEMLQFERIRYEGLNSPLSMHQITGSKGQNNSGLGMGAMWDTRNHVLNPTKGLFVKSIFEKFGIGGIGSFDYITIQNDIRKFCYVNSIRTTFALQIANQMQWGNVPFYALSFLGGEQIMRGYYSGAYRNNHMHAVQVEIRKTVYKRLGIVNFISSGIINEQLNFSQQPILHLSGGGGIRYLFDSKNNINLRIDVAYSKMGLGVYFGMGEAF